MIVDQWTLEDVSRTEISILYNDRIVETWHREYVPTYGMMWCKYPAGHAKYTGFQEQPPTLTPTPTT